MKCIADVDVLLPLLCGGHVAEKAAHDRFASQQASTIGWCLPIRLAILRHLSNRHIMGSPLLEPEQILAAWDQLEADERLYEITTSPSETEQLFRANVRGREPSPKFWMDAWLAALAEASGLQLVTFDRGFTFYHLSSLTVLEV